MASGNIVVPGYDKVFLTPLAAVLLATVGAVIVRRSGSLYPVAESMVIAMIWLVLFLGGPRLGQWILTGRHRFRVPVRVNASKQMSRQI